uniref:DUF7950 domain-containing protein n=1 Tax=Davidia involucrata TaxID=16924 RepID=A0A5B7B5U9_DAVIN
MLPTCHWPARTLITPTRNPPHYLPLSFLSSFMMIRTLNPYSTTSKTAEIMSRYRPIAPKPDAPPMNPMCEENPSVSQKICESPYLRDVWPHLQARPTRTRKRGRTALAPPTIKKLRTHHLLGLSSPFQLNTSPAKNLALQGFAHGLNGLPPLPIPSLAGSSEKPAQAHSNLVTLPLLPCPPSLPTVAHQPTAQTELNGDKGIDLNMIAEIPEENDFLQQLQGPTTSTNIIAPQPVRPVGSSISVGCINHDQGSNSATQVPKKGEEVEEDVESEALPAVVSDSNNKVRMANSAYKEMVGQPECSWLDTMVSSDGRHGAGGACMRICGEVMLQFSDSSVPVSSNGFSCWVRIEWGSNGKKSSINAFSDVMRLSCESRDYLFAWRFHTREASESCSNV